ncbi:hypothetical protein BT96DRAFT_989455 [Gymnopus androsaceus JB14]|uniref:Uncharacterized protein n=1 Tax=Gymnopus androsaceus JB14 TaxID=1447944 RepID=A0A6A4I6L3_9AGAR|nr:hypothetical protein BT96DRAFT_989455 [Gymnopus androsaceus JB14]
MSDLGSGLNQVTSPVAELEPQIHPQSPPSIGQLPSELLSLIFEITCEEN